MPVKTVTVFYSKRSGKRIAEKSAKRDPDWAFSLTLDPNFLRGKQIAISTDGMPCDLENAAKAADLWNKRSAKLVRRRAAYAKSVAGRRPAVHASYSINSGMRVSERFAKSNPSKVESFSLDPQLLKKNDIVMDPDGAASNLSAARAGAEFTRLADNIRLAKNAEKRAKRKAAKAAKKFSDAKRVERKATKSLS